MDAASIAIAAVAFLHPYLQEVGKGAAKKVGESVTQKGEHLLSTIRTRFRAKPDGYALQTLERMEADPANEGRQGALTAVLKEEAEKDHAFQTELAQLVLSLAKDESVTRFVTNVSGDARVGKLINIGSAHDVRIE